MRNSGKQLGTARVIERYEPTSVTMSPDAVGVVGALEQNRGTQLLRERAFNIDEFRYE